MSLTLTLERGGGEVSGSGTNIELDGTIAGGAIESAEMYGDTEQTTYSGKNLWGIPSTSSTVNYITYTPASDGSFSLSGTATADAEFSVVVSASKLGIVAGQNYTFSATSSDVIYFIFNCDSSGTWKKTLMSFSPSGSPITSTCPTLVDSYVKLVIRVLNGTSISQTGIKAQLESGNQATSFEPYVGGTASPNPDYPQEVQTVTGEQTITVSNGQGESQVYPINLGKNLFDIDQYTNAVTRGSTLVSLTKTSDTTLRTTNLYASTNNYCAIPIPDASRLLGNTITMSCNVTLTNVAATKAAIFWKTTSNSVGTQIGDTLSITTGGAKTLTFSVPDAFPSGTNGIFCAIYGSDSVQPADSYVDWENIQIEKGSSATSFAPYFTPIELCKIGTYQDYIYKSGEDWYVHKEINQLVLNGSESWETTGTNVYALYVSGGIKSVAEGLSGVCNYYTFNPVQTNVTITLTTGQFAVQYINPNTQHRLFMKNTAISTTSDFQTWLGSHNTTVYYPLATPTDTQITDATLIAQLEALNEATTYDGTTIITVNSENLAGSLEVTVSSNIAKTYTEVEIGSPFTITDVEGKSSNTTLDGNVYVDWAYNKKQYSFDLFNLTPQDYADIRAFYDYQFNNSAFPTITVPELNIDKLPVYMEISSRNIINQCLLTDKLTLKFRETVQP